MFNKLKEWRRLRDKDRKINQLQMIAHSAPLNELTFQDQYGEKVRLDSLIPGISQELNAILSARVKAEIEKLMSDENTES